MAQKQNNAPTTDRTKGLDVVKISFRHKWLRKEFDKKAGELSYLFGKDIVFMGIRQYCFEKLDERDKLHREAEAEKAFQEYNEA